MSLKASRTDPWEPGPEAAFLQAELLSIFSNSPILQMWTLMTYPRASQELVAELA